MSVQNFLNLKLADFGDRVPSHQELKTKGLLLNYNLRISQGPVGFISHQWTSWTSADPNFVQLGVLKRFFERILTGDVKRGEDNFPQAQSFRYELVSGASSPTSSLALRGFSCSASTRFLSEGPAAACGT